MDTQAASTFIATFLRAIRKGTLQVLQASPKDYGIPTRWVTWLTDAFERDPLLKTLLKNPHPNSSRFELELLQLDLATLSKRYPVDDAGSTPLRQDTAQHRQTDSTSSSSSRTHSNDAQKKDERCLVM